MTDGSWNRQQSFLPPSAMLKRPRTEYGSFFSLFLFITPFFHIFRPSKNTLRRLLLFRISKGFLNCANGSVFPISKTDLFRAAPFPLFLALSDPSLNTTPSLLISAYATTTTTPLHQSPPPLESSAPPPASLPWTPPFVVTVLTCKLGFSSALRN
ncbi:hypothetical protein D0Y65_027847 [Glycine soja]|uniref:Uncharacterized protein n=1 Tax=Glycine soja TaxID=3848 RepID=A0A445IRA8_GLYSO|nr:hypothetical protein D0Y65_027847 [Glycine soja]